MERRAEGNLKVVVFNLSQVPRGPEAVSRTRSTHMKVQVEPVGQEADDRAALRWPPAQRTAEDRQHTWT